MIGCSLVELPTRVGWDEWLLWRAWYAIEPWGESRADLRQSVAIAYTLSPYLSRGTELPQLVWPYYDSEDDLPTPEELQAAAEAERVRWAEWEASRKRVARPTELAVPELKQSVGATQARPTQ